MRRPPRGRAAALAAVSRVALGAVLAAVLASAAFPGGVHGQEPGPAAGVAAAPGLDWRLAALDGRELALRDLIGRPLLVNVWATWCLPCVAELRSFERLARSLAGEEIGFVMVAPQERSAVAEWVRRRGYELPFYVEVTRMPGDFGLDAVPTTWVLDRAGRVVLKQRGAVDWDREDVRTLLRALAADGSGRR